MSINNAEHGVGDSLINEIKQLRADLDTMRATPQPGGNGSINYAVAGPFTIPAGYMARYGVTYAPDSSAFYYDGKEALHKTSLIRVDWSVRVDSDDADHTIPYGAALAGPETRLFYSEHVDYYASARTDVTGQITIYYEMLNLDTVSHNYWLKAQVLVPRPALKQR
ncbi:hypothetical protein [Mycolicibacterium sp. S3B2]|uniref:hypothetical protein n=1 Tax=Mycolicibacterium sp. S3B2 TaxID=3415120 RepID=UPI003C7BA7BF